MTRDSRILLCTIRRVERSLFRHRLSYSSPFPLSPNRDLRPPVWLSHPVIYSLSLTNFIVGASPCRSFSSPSIDPICPTKLETILVPSRWAAAPHIGRNTPMTGPLLNLPKPTFGDP